MPPRARKNTEETTTEQHFEAIIQRAKQLGVNTGVHASEVELGEEWGFTPPIVVKPMRLVSQEAFDRANRGGDVFGMARALFGDNYARIALTYDKHEQGDVLFAMAVVHCVETLYGKDAASGLLPGGSQAS